MTGSATEPVNLPDPPSPSAAGRWVAAALLLLLLSAAPLLATGDAVAQARQNQPEQSLEPQIDSETAAARVRAATGGRVLAVQLRGGGRPVYLVRVLLAEGRVRSYRVDAVSGRLLD